MSSGMLKLSHNILGSNFFSMYHMIFLFNLLTCNDDALLTAMNSGTHIYKVYLRAHIDSLARVISLAAGLIHEFPSHDGGVIFVSYASECVDPC